MNKKPLILKETIVAQSRLFDIKEFHLRFSNGQERYFERISGRGCGSVMIVPILNEETILLVREYGTGVGDYVLGFPKGAIENKEDILITAERELKEEIGYGARDMSIIACHSVSPSYLHSMMHVIIARGLYKETAYGDEPEPLEIIPWKLSNLDKLLAHPEFHEARSIAALFLVERQQCRR